MSSTQNYAGRGGAPQTIDLRKLPPGHMTFTGGRDAAGLYIAHGHPYDLQGNKLPADISWLRENGYTITEGVTRALAQHQVVAPTPVVKQCVKCSSDIPMGAKFCLECGAQQAPKIWTPGDNDEEANALARLIDPADPLGSLTTISKAVDEAPVKRQTPDEIFNELQANESREAARDLKGATGLEGLGETKYEDTTYGKLEMSKEKGKK